MGKDDRKWSDEVNQSHMTELEDFLLLSLPTPVLTAPFPLSRPHSVSSFFFASLFTDTQRYALTFTFETQPHSLKD